MSCRSSNARLTMAGGAVKTSNGFTAPRIPPSGPPHASAGAYAPTWSGFRSAQRALRRGVEEVRLAEVDDQGQPLAGAYAEMGGQPRGERRRRAHEGRG